ncbi:MAG: nitroreductase/quinone reductase family protein [Pseudolysinimonas sp.]
MPSNRFFRVMNTLHRGLLRTTGGRVGWRAYGMPMLELTTTGRTSRQKRTTMLSSPLQLGDTVIIVASRGGDDVHPGWYHNLVAEPRVEVVLRGRAAVPMRARVATPAERADLWPKITKDHPNFAAYQVRTEREIPVVLLEPVRDHPA